MAMAAGAGGTAIDGVMEGLATQNYLCDRRVATVVYLARQLQRPILVEGPAGVGKTELAKAVAGWLGLRIIRLQCYEGIDEARALYEWEYKKQLLYIQMAKHAASDELEEGIFSERFLLRRPLLEAITASDPVLLLLDEVDKSDPAFEALLLEVLSDFQVSIPELGCIKAQQTPVVLLTSNQTRELGEPLKRRCLYLYIEYPSQAQELAIVRLKVPGITGGLAEQAVQVVQYLREAGLSKPPSISETLDWARSLHHLGVDGVDEQVVLDTATVLLKNQSDVERATAALSRLVRSRRVPN